MSVYKSIRWAFNFTEWKPTWDQLKLCLQCIQKEEKVKIDKFVHLEDYKSSMIGQLLIRKAASEDLHIPYNKVAFSRTESGKPFLVKEDVNFNFNISHHGDFCVLASEQYSVIGVDVMRIEHRGNRSQTDYFNLMKKQFSHTEWEFINLPGTEKEQLQRFYRLWCLKESYVKAIGTGIAFDLRSLSFSCPTSNLEEGKIITDTELYVNGNHSVEWIFEETALDSEHYVAVALNRNDQNFEGKGNSKIHLPTSFAMLSFEELMKNAIPFETEEENYWDIFSRKPCKVKDLRN